MINIQDIWPEAFETSQPVRLCGEFRKFRQENKTMKAGFYRAWFACRDGRIYNLSKEELKAFMPEAIICPTYRRSKK